MASSVRAFFGGGASSDLCAAKKAATAAFRSPSGPACLRKASSGGVRGRGGGAGFGWGAAAGDAFGGGTRTTNFCFGGGAGGLAAGIGFRVTTTRGGGTGAGGAGDFAFGGAGCVSGAPPPNGPFHESPLVGFGTSAPDASTDVLRIACNPKRCTAAWYSRAAVSSSLYVLLQIVYSDASLSFACQPRLDSFHDVP